MEDELYLAMKNYLDTGTLPTSFPSTKSNFISNCKTFSLNKKKFLIRLDKLVLSQSMLDDAWVEVHQHSGRDKTYQKFKKRFWFRGMSVWVRRKVKDCVPCSNKNNAKWPAHRTPLIPIPVEPKMWWRVHVDLIGPLPTSRAGRKYICIAVCALSKYMEAKRNIYQFFF